MAVTAAFRDYILEQLNRVVPTTARSMFGGFGLYAGGAIFGLLDDDALYFKVDDGNRPDFEAAGCQPFRPFGPDSRPMGYYQVPADAIDDPEALRPWVGGALAASRAARVRSGTRLKATARSREGVKLASTTKPGPKPKAGGAPGKRASVSPGVGAGGNPGGVTDAAVEKATGRNWAAWLKLLDGAGCRTMSHREIVAVVKAKHDVGAWWGQMITVGYEQARGLREVHQKADGFSASASRTIGVPLAELYRAWAEAPRRRTWLPPLAVTLKSSSPPRSMRLELKDAAGTVRLEFTARDSAKSVVTVQHDRLANARDVKKMKSLWGDALQRLKERLESRR